MVALSETQREAATLYRQMVDAAMPQGRIHPGDGRHLGGAFQGNRVIPFEGICAAALTSAAQDLLMKIVERFIALLPTGPRKVRLLEVRQHLAETWFCWIGGRHPGEVFYYRIQSPVIVIELDHHCGVFLDYDTPRPLHIHTVMRTPHGNDYGRPYVGQWCETHAR